MVCKLHGLLAEAGFADVNPLVVGTKTLAAFRAYQASRKLIVDGIVGLQTWTSLLHNLPAIAESEQSPFKVEVATVSERPTLKLGSEGSIVEELQRRLLDEGFDPGPVDGIFGPKTKAVVVSYQDSFGLEPDGVCGPITWRAVLS